VRAAAVSASVDRRDGTAARVAAQRSRPPNSVPWGGPRRIAALEFDRPRLIPQGLVDDAQIRRFSLNSQSNYENGHRSPDAVYLERVATLGVDVSFLLLGRRTPSPLPVSSAVRPDPLGWRGRGWQSVDGPVTGWVSHQLAELPEFKEPMQRTQASGVRWLTAPEELKSAIGVKVEADFALLPNSWTAATSDPGVDRLEQIMERLHRGAFGIVLSDFENDLDSVEEHGNSIREVLWRRVFRVPGPFEPGAVFLVRCSNGPGSSAEKRLLRVERITGARWPDQWLVGHWEETGDLAEVGVTRLQGPIVHVGTSETFEPSQFAEWFRAHAQSRPPLSEDTTHVSNDGSALDVMKHGTEMRAITREEAALLDNYGAADEKGRAAARSVLDALAQPKRANG
jgi:hypothetical protein